MQCDRASHPTTVVSRYTLLLLELSITGNEELMKQPCSSFEGEEFYLCSILSCAFEVKWGVLTEAKVTQERKAQRK